MSEASKGFVSALEGLMDALHQHQRSMFRDWKLTAIQFFVLRWISKEGKANMSTLAETLGVRRQTVTPIGDSLERAGLIRRIRPAEDRREVILVLTPKGTRLLDSIRTTYLQFLADALDEAPATSLAKAEEALRSATARIERTSPYARRATPAAPKFIS
jgi:DNA-binding MarR family transcriptional regulator